LDLERNNRHIGGLFCFCFRDPFGKDAVMAESIALASQRRQSRGKQAARQLRRRGLVPGVLYGHKEETISLTLQNEDVQRAIRQGARVVDLQTDGKTQKALIKEVQWDHLGKEVLHVDFARVAADERVVVSVPIEIRGTAVGVTAGGGVLDQPMHILSVECLAIAVPDSIRVNIGELQLDQAIHVRELVMPEGVKAMADPEAVVVQVIPKLVEAEAAAAPAAATPEQAEPEVIRRERSAEEEEAEAKKAEGKGQKSEK
jgi:large subunit ribosomal protein L25